MRALRTYTILAGIVGVAAVFAVFNARTMSAADDKPHHDVVPVSRRQRFDAVFRG